MKQLETTITIEAPAQKVWNILTDFSSYPEWNPFIQTVTGDPQQGKQLGIQLKVGDRSPQTFQPIVLVNEPAREFRWRGKLFIKGLFDGEHYFQLQDLGANRTRLIHGENFSGLLSGLIMRSIEQDTREGFERMNHALKQRAEQKA
jgi:hypothetical protein